MRFYGVVKESAVLRDVLQGVVRHKTKIYCTPVKTNKSNAVSEGVLTAEA